MDLGQLRLCWGPPCALQGAWQHPWPPPTSGQSIPPPAPVAATRTCPDNGRRLLGAKPSPVENQWPKVTGRMHIIKYIHEAILRPQNLEARATRRMRTVSSWFKTADSRSGWVRLPHKQRRGASLPPGPPLNKQHWSSACSVPSWFPAWGDCSPGAHTPAPRRSALPPAPCLPAGRPSPTLSRPPPLARPPPSGNPRPIRNRQSPGARSQGRGELPALPTAPQGAA